MSFLLFTFDWVVVRSDGVRFILPDAAVSCRDPNPDVPGAGAAPMSSASAQTFIPLDPIVGLLLQPNEQTFRFQREHGDLLEKNEVAAILDLLDGMLGPWTEVEATDEIVGELNLLSYAHAHRYVYGRHADVVDVLVAARRDGAKVSELRPRPPRLHILEADPDRPGLMVETHTIAADDPRTR